MTILLVASSKTSRFALRRVRQTYLRESQRCVLVTLEWIAPWSNEVLAEDISLRRKLPIIELLNMLTKTISRGPFPAKFKIYCYSLFFSISRDLIKRFLTTMPKGPINSVLLTDDRAGILIHPFLMALEHLNHPVGLLKTVAIEGPGSLIKYRSKCTRYREHPRFNILNYNGDRYCFYRDIHFAKALEIQKSYEPNPWVWGGTFTQAPVIANSDNEVSFLASSGISHKRIYKISGFDEYRMSKLIKSKIPRNIVLWSIPQYWEHEMASYGYQCQLIKTMIACFSEIFLDLDIVASFHPKANRSDYESIDFGRVKVSSEIAIDILAESRLLIGGYTSLHYLSNKFKIPSVIVDDLNLKYQMFSSNSYTIRVGSVSELKKRAHSIQLRPFDNNLTLNIDNPVFGINKILENHGKNQSSLSGLARRRI